MKLSEFYTKARDGNDNGDYWASHYYGVFSKIVDENKYEKTAEIGAGYGTHSKYILKNNTSVKHHIIIDPMRYYPNDGFATDIMSQDAEIPGNNFNELFDLINEDLAPWKDKYTWFRKSSQEITTQDIPDESLDCVFIDGDHSYNAVLADLKLFWNKVRSGGQLLGDDYWMNDVHRAVDDFSKYYNISYDLLEKPGTNYKIYRFHKHKII